ncbi:hypothetical protein V1498_02435 [Peribacillus sp. SCS-26]|uniref:hypothetical protein n=1 Tax=Paraperibacillus marinus TaxID=3115295 RepID=UPI003905D176
MLRYWKSSLLAAAIILAIGVFYTKSALSSQNLPQYSLVKDSGDSSEVKDLALYAYYQEGSVSDNLKIKGGKTTYQSDLSFIRQLNSPFNGWNSKLETLQGKYRNFMRGKDNIEGLFEDDTLLAYAYTNGQGMGASKHPFTAKISVLNKKTKNSTSFEARLPDSNHYRFVYVEDVQYFGSELKVITKNYRNNYVKGMDSEEVHIYTFDVPNQKLLSDENVFGGKGKKGIHQYFIIGNSNYAAPSDYVMYRMDPEYRGDQETRGESKIFAYDLRKSQTFEVKLPAGLKGKLVDEIQNYHYQDNLYLIEDTEKEMNVVQIDLKSQEKRSFKLASALEAPEGREYQTSFHNGKLYSAIKVSNQERANIAIRVIDLDTGAELYKGHIKSDKDQSPDELQITDFVIE